MSHRVQALEFSELQRQNNSVLDKKGLNFNIALAESFPPGHKPQTEPASEKEIVKPQFKEELKRSWAYSRNSVFLTSSLERCSTGIRASDYLRPPWSQDLSRLSMSELSDISVLNLAVSVEEVKNPKRLSQTWSNCWKQ